MNASATIRASYMRQARMSMAPHRRIPSSISETTSSSLQPRPASDEKLKTFVRVDHIEHREACNTERLAHHPIFDISKNRDTEHGYIDNSYLDNASFFQWDDNSSVRVRLKTMFTVFPYRDPIYLVAIIFLLGSVDLVINAFFDLLPRTNSSTAFEGEESVAVPTTVLIGSILFFVAGVFDTFGALNADAGSVEVNKGEGRMTYQPALLGTPEFRWLPNYGKLRDLALNNLAFQAGLIVLFGGVVFMFAGIVDFPGLIPESSFSTLVIFGPQVIHGLLFFVANVMLAISEQEKWWKPKVADPDWQSAFLNAVGGFGFMMAGVFLFQEGEGSEDVKAAIAAMVGSWAFLIGSVVRLYVVLEFW
jgi:hypothetical protein